MGEKKETVAETDRFCQEAKVLGINVETARLETELLTLIESTISTIKERSGTYAEAIEIAEWISWPKQKPSQLESHILKIIQNQVITRLKAEHFNVPIKG